MARFTSDGAPIANCECYILDSKGQPVKEGEVGELYLGGDCLARGHLNREKITRERFIKDRSQNQNRHACTKREISQSASPDERSVGFLGAYRQSVKIRGHRVELGGRECDH